MTSEDARPTQDGDEPAWRRVTERESRWPALITVAVTVVLQVALPDKLTLGPRWLVPGAAALMVVALLLINPDRLERHHKAHRMAALTMVAMVSIGNGFSAVVLVQHILNGSVGDQAGPLLSTGAVIYLTNIVVFAMWYWEFDRGGPGARAQGVKEYPDFLFPQMSTPEFAPTDWEPGFVDYLYLSFTNATAFSPTDVMPLRYWAKLLMLAQSAVSLLLVVLVVARAVNIMH
ncbi:DUF1345 domain-containing protein [Solihabitans fulvus]|uniref:DUF1345 domain-containing protein n=1 Tax=Solihabitans fulvus TaxID=1892852 RepID=A0A5B2X8N0_9PSEU|nr:DUF1345 domain-containing protein [Solihabitans fulvus]KAA2259503.1 DUF1345 domain-containing protein [Solihabitans fulvus]